MEQRFFHAPGASLWRGTSLSQTHTPSPIYMTLHAAQEPKQTRQLPTSPPSIMILPALTSSSQLPLKLLGHGTRWLLSWFRKLAGGSHLSLRTPGRQCFCSSACPLSFNGGMRSPPTALSPPSKRRCCGLTCLVFNISYLREFSTEG